MASFGFPSNVSQEFAEVLLQDGMRWHGELNAWVDYSVVFAVPAAYLVVILGALQVTKGKAVVGDGIRPFMRLYNLVQVGVCLYMAVELFRYLLFPAPAIAPLHGLQIPNPFGINAQYSSEVEWVVFVHYVTKYLDFFDTIFMVLRGKTDQISFLHLYHHCTIGAVWGFLLRVGHGNGTAGYGAFINSVIHVIMYSHYFITSFGIRNPFKPLITSSQILQFYSCIAHAVLIVFTNLDTVFPRSVGLLQVAYHISMIYLFTSFYRRSYGKKTKAKSA